MSSEASSGPALPALTAKQREVLALVADNRTSKEIAALLGISESAVNQRIEIIRGRLGGLPRGELARLYRQEYAPPDSPPLGPDQPTWQKIQLPAEAASRQGAGAEGSSIATPGGSHQDGWHDGAGSRPSAGSSRRAEPVSQLVRAIVIAGVVLAAMTIAAWVTLTFGSGTGG